MLFVQFYPKGKDAPYLEMSRDNDQKEENLLIWKGHLTLTKKDAYIKSEFQLQNHSLAFVQTNESLLPATSFLFCSPKAYNTTDSLDKLTCTDHVNLVQEELEQGR